MCATALTPAYETRGPLLLAGIKEAYTHQSSARIPEQWARFGSHIGRLEGEVRGAVYGVVLTGAEADAFNYMTAVEVADVRDLPKEFDALRLDAPRYAVFRHEGHVTKIPDTMRRIYCEFMPSVEGKRAAGAEFLERYRASFDPRTGLGGFDVLVPLRNDTK